MYFFVEMVSTDAFMWKGWRWFIHNNMLWLLIVAVGLRETQQFVKERDSAAKSHNSLLSISGRNQPLYSKIKINKQRNTQMHPELFSGEAFVRTDGCNASVCAAPADVSQLTSHFNCWMRSLALHTPLWHNYAHCVRCVAFYFVCFVRACGFLESCGVITDARCRIDGCSLKVRF